MRMLCTGCWRTARPDLRLPGSDRLELAAWLCLALPGLLYCWWRHAGRRRVCAACGSGDLVREARRARVAGGEVLAWGGGRLWAERPLRWPAALATPRARLHAGGLGVAAVGAILARPELALLGLVGWSAWLAVSVRRQVRGVRPAAFDESGRAIPIEALR